MNSASSDQPQRQQLVTALQEAVQRLEVSGRSADPRTACVGSSCGALDRLLPGGGFARGSLVEWLAAPGSGAATLALLAAREAGREGGAIVVLDPEGLFYPPAAVALGLELPQLVVIRGTSRRDTLWALDQALRCSAVAAVWTRLPARIDDRTFRRLQLAAERGGSLGLLLREPRVRGQPSWSDLQLLVQARALPRDPQVAPRAAASRRRLRVELLRGRRAAAGSRVDLELDELTGVLCECEGEAGSRQVGVPHETHSLHLAAQLAHPVARRRSARA